MSPSPSLPLSTVSFLSHVGQLSSRRCDLRRRKKKEKRRWTLAGFTSLPKRLFFLPLLLFGFSCLNVSTTHSRKSRVNWRFSGSPPQCVFWQYSSRAPAIKHGHKSSPPNSRERVNILRTSFRTHFSKALQQQTPLQKGTQGKKSFERCRKYRPGDIPPFLDGFQQYLKGQTRGQPLRRGGSLWVEANPI